LAALIFLTARVVFHRAEYRFAEDIRMTGALSFEETLNNALTSREVVRFSDGRT
jgi:hypothetical protein